MLCQVNGVLTVSDLTLLQAGIYVESRHSPEVFAPHANTKMLAAHCTVILGKHYAVVLGMQRALFFHARPLLLGMHCDIVLIIHRAILLNIPARCCSTAILQYRSANNAKYYLPCIVQYCSTNNTRYCSLCNKQFTLHAFF